MIFAHEWTKYKWSFFIKSKDELHQKGLNYIKAIEQEGKMTVKAIRCDNAKENVKLQEKLFESGRKIKFEFTAPNTPQQNGIAERSLAFVAGRARVMQYGTMLDFFFWEPLWAEAFFMATKVSNILAIKFDNDEVSSSHRMLTDDEDPKWSRIMHEFG